MQRLYKHDINNTMKYAYQYQEAFEILYKKHVGGSHLVLPTLYMLRHSLELMLKAKIEYLAQFSASNNLINKLNNEHKLTSLSNSFLEHYALSKQKLDIKDDDSKYLNDFKSLISFFTELDNYSYTFRYPKDKEGNSTLNAEYIDINFQPHYEKTMILLEYLTDFFPE